METTQTFRIRDGRVVNVEISGDGNDLLVSNSNGRAEIMERPSGGVKRTVLAVGTNAGPAEVILDAEGRVLAKSRDIDDAVCFGN